MNEDKFTGKAEIYSSHRPTYPQQIYTFLLGEAGIKAGDAIADIGAGTGIFSKPLAERGCKVYAVEPNADMRRIAARSTSGLTGFLLVDGTAEATTLEDASVSWVTAAQAFHWFNAQRFADECRRILVPGGTVLLAYNHRLIDDPITNDTFSANKKHCPKFAGFSGGMPNRAEGKLGSFFRDGLFSTREFRHEYHLDENGFVGRALSSSYAPVQGNESYDAYIHDLKCIFGKYARKGKVCARLVCKIYWGEV